jgi:phosphatidylserine/phosphatidylglycerophosphate/cardiolipin synthase-like enzyme
LFGEGVRFRDVAGGTHDSVDEVLLELLGRPTPCAVEAVEGTILFSIFGVPFDRDAARELRPDREFQRVNGIVRGYVANGTPLGTVFERMRAPSGETAPYLAAVVRAARQPSADDASDMDEAIEHRLRQLIEVITYVAEPVRIRSYLHSRVDELEGALRTSLPEGLEEHLVETVRGELFRSVTHMRRLRGLTPAAVLDKLEPLVDRWFQRDALPALRASLARDPFSAYWFFVQTGGITGPRAILTETTITVDNPAFALTEFQDLTCEDALERLGTSRVPPSFVTWHSTLETAFTGITFSHDDALALIEKQPVTESVRTKLRQLLLSEPDSQEFSTLDVYGDVLRDASKIRGRLDRDSVRTLAGILHDAKADRLAVEIARMLSEELSEDSRLHTYMRTAAALMLELERRQAVDTALQQSTSGAAVGWLLSQFFIAGKVPAALWAPGGVTGREFAEVVDELTPKNQESGNLYRGKPAASIQLVKDGSEYHNALVDLIDSAERFLNIAAFDWKTDAGGRDIAYRLMAKKLGISGDAYTQFLKTFEGGLAIDRSHPAIVPFYDIPTTRFKDLLVSHFFLTSDHPDVANARVAAQVAGATLECATVKTCGDLEPLRAAAGRRYQHDHPSPAHHAAWRAYQLLEGLFKEREPQINAVRPRRALRDYCEDPEALRRFVRRVGLRQPDAPDEPFTINIVTDAKQNLSNIRFGRRSEQFPYFVMEPIRDIYFPLLEFDIRVMLWKGALEFPWRLGPVPVPGRKMFGIVPMPFIPWPWLNAIPACSWAGPIASVFMQYLLATDVRIWWASVSHTKSWSTESAALQSGMGMGTKYYNEHTTHKTWHDMGAVVRGAPVNDVNDHFVQVFNEARVNNAGLPTSRGVSIPRLRYEDYTSVSTTPGEQAESHTWLITTHPERGDAGYRGAFVAALAAARHNIYIENPFFSDPLIARLLIRKAREFRGRVVCGSEDTYECAARMRDAVQIHLVLPDTSDKPLVDAIGTADVQEMLHLGIKVYRWRPEDGWSATSMLHSKVWLIDYSGGDGLAYVGAANATQRSHIADNEAGILSNDGEFARQVYERVFLPDTTIDSRLESGEMFQFSWSSSAVLRASRWLRRLLVDLFWFV